MTRRLALLVAAVIVAGACSAPDASERTSASPSAADAILPLERGAVGEVHEIVVVGGSVMNEIAIALEAALEPAGFVAVRNETKRGVDLMGLDTNLEEVWDEALRTYSPDVVVTQMTFDGPVFDCVGTREERERCAEEGRRLWYQEQLRAVTDALTKTGAALVWIGFPPIAPVPDTEESARRDARGAERNAWTEVYAREDDRFTYVDGRSPLEGVDGGYSSYLPTDDGQWRQARKPDGLHLCPHGAALLVRAIAPEIVAGVPVEADAAWIGGDWRRHDTYIKGSRPIDPEVVCTDEPSPERILLPHVSAGSDESDLRG